MSTNAIENVDLLVMEATYTSDLRELAVEHGHCTALDTARIAAAAGAFLPQHSPGGRINPPPAV